MLTVREIMRRPPRTILPNENLIHAAELMDSDGIGSLIVKSKTDDRLLGILTDRDIVIRALARGKDPSRTSVSESMTTPVFWCYETDASQEAVRIMEERQVRRLAVLERFSNTLCGVLSLDDIALKTSKEIAGEVLREVVRHAG